MKIVFAATGVFLIGVVGIAFAAEKDLPGASGHADTVYTNGKIYTVNEVQPWVEAVAIKDGAFVMVGTSEEVKVMIGKGTRVVDLTGKMVMPGLHDAHVHIEQAYIGEVLGEKLPSFPDDVTDPGEAGKILKGFADKNADAEVVFVQGLPYATFGTIPNAWIDEALPDRPVVLLSDTEHEAILNTKALELEGLTTETPAPDGGEIEKDSKSGKLTGWLKESAAGRWGWKRGHNRLCD